MGYPAFLTLIILIFNFLAPVQAADDISIKGVWKTQKEDKNAHIAIMDCPDKPKALCGKIIWLQHPIDDRGQPQQDRLNPDVALQSQPIIGMMLLKDFVRKDSRRVWADGTIYNPEDGKIYSCTLTLTKDDQDKDILEVHGYVGIELLGETQYWMRKY